MRLFNIVFAAILILLSGGILAAGYAADLSRNYTETESQPKNIEWSGLYIGGTLGYGNANHDLTVQLFNVDPEPGEPSTYDLANIDGMNSHGVIGGFQLGYDYQLDSTWVVGVRGSYGFNDMETKVSITDFGKFSLEKSNEWSIGIRAGALVYPETLVYALGDYTRTKYSAKGLNNLGDPDFFSKTSARFGGVSLGGGVEIAAAKNVFVGIEYAHTFYGKETLIQTTPFYGDVGGRLIDDLDEDKVMATLKFKLLNGFFD